MKRPVTLGLDFGSDSVRCVIVDTTQGEVLGTDVFAYPRWNPNAMFVLWKDHTPARKPFAHSKRC
ncbi:MAG: hypothetical protein U1E27_12045 [Kiritimatiellia bacterium]|nr:hypothetical protein [Kiritimatiellia bacterium]